MRHALCVMIIVLGLFFSLGCVAFTTTEPITTICQTDMTTPSTTVYPTTTDIPTTQTTGIPTTLTTTGSPQIEIAMFEQPFGFATLQVSDRQDIDPVIVDSEISFLYALMDPHVHVIEIVGDLYLGQNEVESALLIQDISLSDVRSVYRPHSRQPIKHPHLMESGVGVVRIVERDGLMIYSQNGSQIKHASFLIDGSTDIVLRNLHFTELWEWDEQDFGSYKRNDWDYILIEKSQGIWLDHLTFDQAYDGIIDIKEYSQDITLSWSRLVFEPNDFIESQIEDLETHRVDNPYYDQLRNEGLNVEDVVQYASYQKKGFNFGNSTDGEGYESITVTFHHLEVKNLQDRFPRVRKGDVHLYHVRLNNHAIEQLRLKTSGTTASLINQGIVTTEQGAIMMENSIFEYVSTPIKNHQESNLDGKYTGRYYVKDSLLVRQGTDFFGSSDDRSTLWIHTGAIESLDFRWRNFTDIPYAYQTNDVYFLEETFNDYPPGVVDLHGFDWRIITPMT